MTSKREAIKGLLVDIVVFLFIFTGFAFAYQSTIGDISLLYLLLVVPFFFMYLLRILLHRSIVFFFLLHIALVGIAIFLPFEAELRVLITLFMLMSALYSLACQLKDQWSLSFKTAIAGFFFNLILFVLLNGFDNGSATVFAMLNVSTLLILVASVVYVHLENLDFNLIVHTSLYKRYDGNMTAGNNKIILAFAAILAVGGVLSFIVPLGSALAAVIAGIYGVFAWFFVGMIGLLARVLAYFFPEITPFALVEAEESPFDVELNGYERELTDSGGVLAVIIIAVSVIVVCGVIYMAFLLYQASGSKERKALNSSDYTVDKVKFAFSDLRSLLPHFRKLVKHPVRRAYIKKVKSHMKHGVVVEPHDTPDMIADKILHREDVSELTGRYEIVRYGRP